MEIIWSIFLGAIQGITEILPISSSAHLVLVPWFFEVADQGLAFDVALHLGSLAAIMIAFWSEWATILKDSLKLFKYKLKPQNHNQKMAYYLILASIPGALAGYFFEDVVASVLRSPYVIVCTLVIYGLVLILADKIGKKVKPFEKIGLKEAVIVGSAQALALIPGTSRSGVTISAGLLMGLKKDVAAKLSFMISAPIILGAGIVKVPEIKIAEMISPVFFLGVLSSFFFALWAIKFILKYVQNNSYNLFAYYRFALALVILIFILRS